MSNVDPTPNPYAPPASVPSAADPGGLDAAGKRRVLRDTLIVVLITTIVVTATSYVVPDAYAATAVGLVFLASTFIVVLRHDASFIRAHGLSLGGLLEPSQVSPGRLLRDGARALAWALLFFALIAPPFVFGFRYWFGLEGTPKVRAMFPSFDAVFGQILVIALPEEAFFRGYVQTRLDRVFSARKLRILGADLGFAIPLTSLLFAIGHLLTLPNPGRLAVFFPSLLFGFLRVRTGGIGAPVAFHVMCNLLSGALARGYGLGTGG